MRSILEQLYYGKIFPAEQFHPVQSNYRKIQKEASQRYEDFARELEKLDPDLGTRFTQIMDEHSRIFSMECTSNYIDGFRLGAQIMIEVLHDAQSQI